MENLDSERKTKLPVIVNGVRGNEDYVELYSLTKQYATKFDTVLSVLQKGYDINDASSFFYIRDSLYDTYNERISITLIINFYNKFFCSPNVMENGMIDFINILYDRYCNKYCSNNRIYLSSIMRKAIKIADELNTNDIEHVIDEI